MATAKVTINLEDDQVAPSPALPLDPAISHRPDAAQRAGRGAGLLLARSRTSDIVDAHVAVCAQRAGQPVVTSDPGDLSRIDPELTLIAI